MSRRRSKAGVGEAGRTRRYTRLFQPGGARVFCRLPRPLLAWHQREGQRTLWGACFSSRASTLAKVFSAPQPAFQWPRKLFYPLVFIPRGPKFVMPVFSCSNCGFRFTTEEKKNCPRCSSGDTHEFKQSRHERGGVAVVSAERPAGPEGVARHKPVHYRGGKGGWVDFHSQQTNVCPHCCGTEFERDYRKKEKTCKKCGEILALPRRFA